MKSVDVKTETTISAALDKVSEWKG